MENRPIIGTIYKVVNRLNGKIYIGQTMGSLAQRIRRHTKDAKRPCKQSLFARALRKYGIHNFEIRGIDLACSTDWLNKKERQWIAFYNSQMPNGYNMTAGGEGALGLPMSETAKDKLRQCNLGKIMLEGTKQKIRTAIGHRSPEAREHKSLGHLGHTHSEATKQKMKETSTRIYNESPERRAAMCWIGRHHSDEAKRKIGDARRGTKASAETRIKLSIARRGKRRNFSPEFRTRMIFNIRKMQNVLTRSAT